MKTVIGLGLVAMFSFASIAAADDVTIIKRHTDPDPDTTGSIVLKQRNPDVVVKKKVIIKENDDNHGVVIKGNDDED